MVQRGFTIIELLVVVAILSATAAIMLPALSSAKRSAESAVCKSNQRQVMTGFISVLADYDYRTPAIYRQTSGKPKMREYLEAAFPGIGWMSHHGSPEQSAFVCPTTDRLFDRPVYANQVVGFAFNSRLYRDGAAGDTDLIPWDSIPSPSDHPWMATPWVSSKDLGAHYYGAKKTAGKTWGVGFYHENKANTTYSDGSVRTAAAHDVFMGGDSAPAWLFGD